IGRAVHSVVQKQRFYSRDSWLGRPGRAALTLAVLTVVGILALFAADLHTRYRAAIEEAERSAQGFAEVLAEHTARMFESAQRTLHVAEVIRQQAMAGHYASAEAVNEALRNVEVSSPIIVAIGWTNAAGDLLAHSYEGNPPRPNIADLPHFTVHR